jgi:hypothetical protein
VKNAGEFQIPRKISVMSFANIFHLVSDICGKTGSTCILIGGFAVNYYNVTRQTADIDFLVCEADFRKIEDHLIQAGFKEDFIDDVFVKLSGGKKYPLDLDFMFVDEDTFTTMMEDAKEITIANRKFIVPSLMNLIALKLHSLKYNFAHRLLKDLPDIVNLIKVNRIDLADKEFKELCINYGSEEIYGKIVEFS